MRVMKSSFLHQSGMALVISLILLLLLTLISMSAMRMSGLEEKMAGNDRDRNLAFQAAESALRAGETKIIELWRNQLVPPTGEQPIPNPADGTGTIQYFCNGVERGAAVQDVVGVYHLVGTDNRTSLVSECGDCGADCPVPDEKDSDVWTDDAKTVEVPTDSTLAAQPRYFITFIYSKHFPDPTKDRPIYKFSVTARGVGKSDKSVVILRSYFGGTTGFIED